MTHFSRLPLNARVCVVIEPLWALFGPLVVYYAPLYQKARGLDPVQMGTINSATIAASFVFFMFASPVTNRLGRRRTSLIFDVLSWTVPMLVWAFVRDFTWFLVAGILNSLVRIVIVSWNMLITEDAEDSQRSTIHGWMHLISSTGGLVTLAGGLVISRYGVLEAMPVIYILGSIFMTAMFVIRNFTTVETGPGVLLMEKTRGRPLLPDLTAQVGLALKALKDRNFTKSLGIFVLVNIIFSMDFYRVLYLGEAKGLSPRTVAQIPAVGAVLSLFVFFFVIPRLGKRHDSHTLAGAALFCMACQTALVFLPPGASIPALISVGMLQAGFIVVMTYRDAEFMNGTDSLNRSGLYSIIQALTFLVSIPAGWLGGRLYAWNASLPFAFSIVMYALCFLVALGMGKHNGEAA